MRKAYFAELQTYKSAQTARVQQQNQQMGGDQIAVSLFDQLEGLDAQTLSMVNAKITEIKAFAQHRVSKTN